MNESRDLGGVCYGDSGGPNYVDIDGTLILAAVTSWGDIPCYATATHIEPTPRRPGHSSPTSSTCPSGSETRG